MTDDEAPCPFCRAPPSHIEQLSHQWRYCNVCSKCYVRGPDGSVLHKTETQHDPPFVIPPSTKPH